MKYCKNCHRISRDDDFCSYCGSAVYGDNDHTEDISCNNISDHSHNKESYSSPYSSHPNNGQPAPQAKKKSGCLVFIIIFIVLLVICFRNYIFDFLSNYFERYELPDFEAITKIFQQSNW